MSAERIKKLEETVEKLERKLAKYEQVIEPKRGEFLGQEWYNPATGVLSKWNGRGFTPAFGRELLNIAAVINAINTSAEIAKINGARVDLDTIAETVTRGIVDKEVADGLSVTGPNLFWNGVLII